MAKITTQKNGQLNEADRQQLAGLLIEAGYTVRICKEKRDGKTTNEISVEYWVGEYSKGLMK